MISRAIFGPQCQGRRRVFFPDRALGPDGSKSSPEPRPSKAFWGVQRPSLTEEGRAPTAAMSGSIDGYRLGMSVLRLDDVLAEVMERPADSGIRMIGVDGPSGSGKSTLAARISARIGAPLVLMDDFVSWVDLVGWWPRFEAQVLNPLLTGNDAHFQVRDWESDEFGTSLNGWKDVEWSPIVVLEGLTCTRSAIADRLAYRIWVEAPDEDRLRRGLERDGDTHRGLWLDSMTTERQFFTDDATRTRADLRVNGNPDISHDQESEVVLFD